MAGSAEMVRQIQLLFAHFVVGHGTLPPKRGKPSAKPGPLQLQIALMRGNYPSKLSSSPIKPRGDIDKLHAILQSWKQDICQSVPLPASNTSSLSGHSPVPSHVRRSQPQSPQRFARSAKPAALADPVLSAKAGAAAGAARQSRKLGA